MPLIKREDAEGVDNEDGKIVETPNEEDNGVLGEAEAAGLLDSGDGVVVEMS